MSKIHRMMSLLFPIALCSVTAALPAQPADSKNAPDPPHATAATSALAPAIVPTGLPDSYVNCGDQKNDTWQDSTTVLTTLRSCAVVVPPGGGVAMLIATGSVALYEAAYEAHFALGVDSETGLDSTDRYVNIDVDTGDGSDKSVALSATVPVGTGFHRFYLLGARSAGLGSVRVFDAALSVVVVPAAAAATTVCGATGDGVWFSQTSAVEVVRECSLNVTEAGSALLIASADAALSSNSASSAYEANFRLSMDNASVGSGSSDRFVNTYANTSDDGVDEAVIDTLVLPVSPGQHTFYFQAQRYAGTGPVTLIDPNLSVLIVPNSAAAACGSANGTSFQTTSSLNQVVQQCQITASQERAALVVASASTAMSTNTLQNEYEALFRIGVDDAFYGLYQSDRWINAYADSGDGTDRNMADSALVPVGGGAHTFTLLGSRYNGSGPVFAYDPSIGVVLLPPSQAVIFADGFE